MKLTVALFAILAVFGLSQAAHQVPNFGKGPLHEDIQDFLDLIPFNKVADVVFYYVNNDHEVQELLQYLNSTTVVKDVWVDFQAIPETINLFNYLHKEDIEIYSIVNSINRALNIKELVPPSDVPTQRQVEVMERQTGGLVGFFKEIKALLDYDAFISLYADKVRSSPSFIEFVNELKSENFNQLVNKVYRIKGVQTFLNILKHAKVNVKIVGDFLYVVFGVKVEPRTLVEEITDFYEVLPWEKMTDVVVTYFNEDEKVQQAVAFVFDPEFHALIRAVEALKEFDELVLYFEKVGLSVIEGIQQFHEVIGMEGYVPPKIEHILKYIGKPQKVGEGMVAMIKDLYDLLPLDKIDALFDDKLVTSKVFAEFVAKLTTKELQEIVTNLYAQEEVKQFIAKSQEKGLEIVGLHKLGLRVVGLIKTPPF